MVLNTNDGILQVVNSNIAERGGILLIVEKTFPNPKGKQALSVHLDVMERKALKASL